MRTSAVSNPQPADPSQTSSFPRPIANEETSRPVVVVIEKRAFFRDCLTRCMESAPELEVVAVASVDDWLARSSARATSLVVLCAADSRREDMKKELLALTEDESQVPVIVLSDFDEAEQIVEALDCGARGYLLTTMSFNIVVEALRLVRAGGMFVPASSLVAAQRLLATSGNRPKSSNGMFTARQTDVIEALRKGKANKIIAYELKMCESTVKVHVRNIMKKLKAKNRTEVAFMANELLRNSG